MLKRDGRVRVNRFGDFDTQWYQLMAEKEAFLALLKEFQEVHENPGQPFVDFTNLLVANCTCVQYQKCEECAKIMPYDIRYREFP